MGLCIIEGDTEGREWVYISSRNKSNTQHVHISGEIGNIRKMEHRTPSGEGAAWTSDLINKPM